MLCISFAAAASAASLILLSYFPLSTKCSLRGFNSKYNARQRAAPAAAAYTPEPSRPLPLKLQPPGRFEGPLEAPF